MENQLKNIFKAVSKQNEFVQGVLKKENVYIALSIGFFGIYFMSVLERFTSFGEQKFTLLHIVRILTIKLISTGVFLTFFILLTYGIVRTFRGRKNFKLFLIAKGWGGIYVAFITVLLFPFQLGHVIKLGPLYYLVAALPTVASILASLVVVFYLIKYEVLIIRSIFNFSIIKALLIWLFAFIPSFIVYMDFPMLIDRELRDSFWQEYKQKYQNADYKPECKELKKTDAEE
jgi:hypothetical protein